MYNKAIYFSAIFISVISACLLAVFSIFTADDSYILLRYVMNIIQHGEWSFNLTEKVSALTSPFHAIIMVLVGFFTGSHIIHGGKILMVLLLFSSVIILAWKYKNQPLIFILPFISLLLSPFIIMWTVSGLETTLLLFIITLLCVRSTESVSHKNFYIICLLGGLAFLTRFDSILFTAPFLSVYFLARIKILGSFKTAISGAFFYGVIPLAWLLFSLFYFRDILPTSFYSKISSQLSVNTIIYCFQFLFFVGFIPFYLLGLFQAFRNRNLAIILNHFKQYSYMHIALLVIFIYGFANAQVHMAFGYRLLIPYTAPLLLIVMDIFQRHFSSYHNIKAFSGKSIYAVLLIAFTVFQLFHNWYFYYRSVNGLTLSGEYQQLSIYSYKHDFLKVMEDGAKDVQQHMKSQPKFQQRQAQFLTYAEGLIPYRLPELYVYGPLISMRRNDTDFTIDFAKYSDYTYIITNFETIYYESLLRSGKHELISDYEIFMDGRKVGYYIFYNPSPQPYTLTKFVRNHPRDIFMRIRREIPI